MTRKRSRVLVVTWAGAATTAVGSGVFAPYTFSAPASQGSQVEGASAGATRAQVAAQTGPLPPIWVNCGGHIAETCRVCDRGHGEHFCNGECEWVGGACAQKGNGQSIHQRSASAASVLQSVQGSVSSSASALQGAASASVSSSAGALQGSASSSSSPLQNIQMGSATTSSRPSQSFQRGGATSAFPSSSSQSLTLPQAMPRVRPGGEATSSSLGGYLWMLWSGFGVHCFSSILVAVYACIYKMKVVDHYPGDMEECDSWEEEEDEERRDREDERRERRVGLFAMFSSPSTSLWAIFCTPVLAAKNYHIGKVGVGYWVSCCTLFICLSPPFFVVAALIRAILSTRLQRNLRQPTSCAKEFFVGLFCFPCAVGRESLEVDDEEYVRVGCPFDLQRRHFPQAFVEEEEEPRKQGRHCVCCAPRESESRMAWLWSSNKHRDRDGEEGYGRSCTHCHGQGGSGRSCTHCHHCHLPKVDVPNVGTRCDCGDSAYACGGGGRTRVCGPSD